MAYYNKRKSGKNFPVWVWCLGVLSVYFLLLEGKILSVTTEGSVTENEMN